VLRAFCLIETNWVNLILWDSQIRKSVKIEFCLTIAIALDYVQANISSATI
jgi:hypothetical protein